MDPTGKIREFTYESGLECDPKTKQPLRLPSSSFNSAAGAKSGKKAAAAAKKTGYYDYSDNRFVLPDGRRVKVVVNKANRARG